MILNCLRIGLGGLLIGAAFAFPASAQAPLADRSVLTRIHSPTFGDPAAKVEIVARLRADMAAPDLVRLLKQDMDDAIALKVTRTPEFFVNRRPLVELGYEELRALVVEEIRRSYAPAAKK